MELDVLKQRVDSIDTNLILRSVLKKYGVRIRDMNIHQLKQKGVNAQGLSIDSYRPYTPFTIFLKRHKGTLTSNNPRIVNLFDEGGFHNAFNVRFETEAFIVDSRDWKKNKLVNKYGASIFGLTDENMNVLIWDLVYSEYIKRLRNAMLG